MKRKIIFSFLFLFTLTLSADGQKILPVRWKFQTGDKEEYKDPVFNDSAWQLITPGSAWEKQGYPSYDGYAWYRVTFVIPASMKKDAVRYGGMVLNLGKIDDVDFTYFNGKLIGATGKLPPDYVTAYDTPRSFPVAPELIQWGKPNTIAVRVYDASGDGGIWSDPVELITKGNPDFITLDTRFSESDRIFKGITNPEVKVSVRNDLQKTYKGILSIKIVSDFGVEVDSLTREISVRKNSLEVISFPLRDPKPGFYKATAIIESRQANKRLMFNYGVDPEKIVSPSDPQPDFNDFWGRAKKELASVDPKFRLIKIDSLCTSAHNIYLVEMHSLGNALIRGWYSVPVKPGKYPAIMQVPGYSSTIIPAYINYGDDFVSFGLNIRGHGNSKDDINPGFPGYILNNIEDKEKYIYRGAYMDCVRGIDFLFSRPEVDTSCVVVEGASQGGALTFATAALDNKRIRLCVPQVPFLSDFQHYFKVATWPANEFINYVETRKKETWDAVFKTLGYFDIKNLAPMIKAPMLMGVGLLDDVCPPHINFAAYNNVPGEKSYIAYPLSGHGLPGDFYKAKMEWIRNKLGMK